MRIAILGWGSLLWEPRPEFLQQIRDWRDDGPRLPLEFSRLSKSRAGALTLVIDSVFGEPCQVAFSVSRRSEPSDAICDLRNREGTVQRHIGCLFADGSQGRSREESITAVLQKWLQGQEIDCVIWTDLPSNFEEEKRVKYSVPAAIRHLQSLPSEGKARAAEYVWRAPAFVSTPLRRALQVEPWFAA